MIRILYILHTLERAGVEKLVFDLICQNRSFIEAQVVCLDCEGDLADALRKEGIGVWFTKRRRGIDITQVFKIAKIVRRWKPDIIHAHQYTPFFYSALAMMLSRNGKLIFTEHGRHVPDTIGWKRHLMNRVLFRQASAITAVCRFTRFALVENERISGNRIEIIYNGINTDVQIEPVGRRALGLDADWPVIVHVGNFRKVKNQGLAIRAMNLLISRGLRAYLVFVGEGEEIVKIKRLAEEFKLNAYVRFLGKRKDVLSILAESDIMINTSISEACSVAILEAMLAGLPVVATDVGGNSELVVENETGFLADVNNADDFANKIERVLCDIDLRKRLGVAGRERVKKYFDVKKMYKEYIDLYERVAGI